MTLGDHPDLNAELDNIDALYTNLGIDVRRISSPTTDAVFHRDVMAWTPHGLIKCRMANANRVYEPDHWFEQTSARPAWWIEAPGTFEGADLLWCGNEAIVARGERTNRDGQEQVAEFLRLSGTKVYCVELPKWHDQHLLGLTNWLNGFVYTTVHWNDLPMPQRLLPMEFKSANFVAVGANRVVTSTSCLQSLHILGSNCETIHLVGTRRLHAHGGGVGCATGIY